MAPYFSLHRSHCTTAEWGVKVFCLMFCGSRILTVLGSFSSSRKWWGCSLILVYCCIPQDIGIPVGNDRLQAPRDTKWHAYLCRSASSIRHIKTLRGWTLNRCVGKHMLRSRSLTPSALSDIWSRKKYWTSPKNKYDMIDEELEWKTTNSCFPIGRKYKIIPRCRLSDFKVGLDGCRLRGFNNKHTLVTRS